jgi:hypothetical protein
VRAREFTAFVLEHPLDEHVLVAEDERDLALEIIDALGELGSYEDLDPKLAAGYARGLWRGHVLAFAVDGVVFVPGARVVEKCIPPR